MSTSPRRVRCFVIRPSGVAEGYSKISLLIQEISLGDKFLSEVFTYLAQSSNQEESFLLHQFVDQLRSAAEMKEKAHNEKILKILRSIRSPSVLSRALDELDQQTTGDLGSEFHLEATAYFIQVFEEAMKHIDEDVSLVSSQITAVYKRALWRSIILKGCRLLEQEREEAGDRLFLSVNRNLPHILGREMREWIGLLQAFPESVKSTIFGVYHIGAEPKKDVFASDSTVFAPPPPPHLPSTLSISTSSPAASFDGYIVKTNPIFFVNCFLMPETKLADHSYLISTAERAFSGLEGTDTHALLKGSPPLNKKQRQETLSFLYQCLLQDVFAVQRIQSIHQQLLLPPSKNGKLFVEWFFNLPLDIIQLQPESLLSSPLHRWLSFYADESFGTSSSDDSESTSTSAAAREQRRVEVALEKEQKALEEEEQDEDEEEDVDDEDDEDDEDEDARVYEGRRDASMSSGRRRVLRKFRLDKLLSSLTLGESENSSQRSRQRRRGGGETYLDESDEDEEALRMRRKRRQALKLVRGPLKAVYESCQRTTHLLHALVLAQQCYQVHKQYAEGIEAKTLGKVTSQGKADIWLILMTKLRIALYLSIALGCQEVFTVNSLESDDQILMAIARAQLHQSWNPGQALADEARICDVSLDVPAGSMGDGKASPVRPPPPSSGPVSYAEELRRAAIHASSPSSRSSHHFPDVVPILRRFPQLWQPAVLARYRATQLLEHWQSQKNNLKALAAGVLHLGSIEDELLRCGAALDFWQKGLRVLCRDILAEVTRVEDIYTIPNQSGDAALEEKTRNESQRRQMFAQMQKVLGFIVQGVSKLKKKTALSTLRSSLLKPSKPLAVIRLYKSSSVSGRERDEDEERASAHREEAVLKGWPAFSSTHAEGLMQWTKRPPTPFSLRNHILLVQILDAVISQHVTGIEPMQLFPSATSLCEESSLWVEDTSGEDTVIAGHLLTEEIVDRRKKLVFKVLRTDDKVALSLGSTFNISPDLIRQKHVLALYEVGQDVLAEEVILQVKNRGNLAIDMATVARERLRVILAQMRMSPKYAPLLTSVPADIWDWIKSDMPPLLRPPGSTPLEAQPSLSATHSLLLQCMSMLSPNSVEYLRVTQMSSLIENLLRHIQWVDGGSKR